MMKLHLKLIGYLLILLTSSSIAMPAQVNSLNKLNILYEYSLPIPEMSGMCWREAEGKKEIAIIGDDEDKIYLIQLQNNIPKITKVIELKSLLEKDFKLGQWESIESDSTGRLFLLQEYPMRIVVLNSNLSKIETIIPLKLKFKIKKKGRNSLGEGVLLLNNKNILIAKEKKPTMLIEYHPKESRSFGYHPKLGLNNKDVFEIVDGQAYVPGIAWKFSNEDAKLIKDVSGINVDKRGNLFLLSDKSQLIVSVEHLKIKQTQIKIKKIYHLPDRLIKPEGMVVDELNRPILTIDSKEKKISNFYILSPIN